MNYLTVRHTIEIPVHPIVGTPALIFKQWFPLGDEFKITIQDDNFEASLWFDEACLYENHQNRDFSKQKNVLCEKINVDVRVNEISPELIDFLRNNIDRHHNEDPIVIKEAEKLGEEVYLICIKTFNRFIQYGKFIKEQYWLEEITENLGRIQDFNITSKAKATDNLSDEKSWFRWRPIHMVKMNIIVMNEEHYIDKTEWKNIGTYVRSGKRIDFSLELLSKSRLLTSLGYRNNAVVDSVIALETALNNFCRNPNKSRLKAGNGLGSRQDTDFLKSTIKHLGFSRSVRYLLPLIIPLELLDEATLKGVSELTELRQNIIHNGTRDVDKRKIYPLLKASEMLTKVLISLTQK